MKIAKNVISALLVIMIVAGIFMAVNKGINMGLLYREREQIGLIIGKQFEANDIRQITEEVFGKGNYIVQKATIYKDVAIIQSEDISEENVKLIVQKLNEKYALEIKVDDIEVEKIGARNVENDLSKYILPAIISLVLISVYFAVRFKKIGSVRTIVRFVTTVLFAELLYISVLAISQVEIGMLLAPVGVMIYVLATLASILVFEKERVEFVLNESK